MPMFTLTRRFDEAWTERDFEKMTRRAIAGLHWSPPVYWHRSYGIDQDGAVAGFCVYETESLRTIQQQQRICWVPFTEAQEVEEACGAASGRGRSEAPEGLSLFLVERTFEPRTLLAHIVRFNTSSQTDDVVWIRSFWDADRKHSRCIFAAHDAEAVRAAISNAPGCVAHILPVLEEHPSAWAEMYDQLGVPRSWEAEAEKTPSPV